MNQLLKMTSGLLLLTILGVLGTMAYALEFDIPLTLAYIQGFFISGYLPFLDLDAINLTFVLRMGATVLFLVVSLIFTFKTISKGHPGIASTTFLGQLVMASFLLTSSSIFYPSYPTLTPTANFLEPFFDFIGGSPLATPLLAIYASLTAFIVIFVFLHIILLISFVRTPYSNLKSAPLAIGREKVIAEELSRFVVPSFQTVPPTKPSLNSTLMLQPQSVVSLPVIEPVTPIVKPIISTPVTQFIQDPKLDQAKIQVSQLKERIRIIIRNELAKQPLIQPIVNDISEKTDTAKPVKPIADLKPDPISLPPTSSDIQGKIKDIIDSHFSSLEPKTKEMVAYLINEELIKYDALNREVLETFIQEKIQAATSDAIEALRLEFTALYDEKVKALTLPIQPISSEASASTQETVPTSTIQDHQVEAIVEKYLGTHPLVQAISVPQQEATHTIDHALLKEELLSQIRSEIPTLQASNASPIDVETVKAEIIAALPISQDIQAVKEDLLTQLRAELSSAQTTTLSSGDLETIKTQGIASSPTSADLSNLKEELLTQLRSEFTTNPPQPSQSTTQALQPDDLTSLKAELIKVIEEKTQQTQVSPIIVAPGEQGGSSINRQDVEKMVAEYLLAHPIYQSSVEAVLPPKLKVKEAKAPSNNLRSEQFRTVVVPSEGVTRTGKKKIIRIPFYTRMAYAHPSLTAQYDELKNYLLAYKVKSRLSNTGDTFRLHKEDFAKITIAGKALKLYLALNPKNYEDSTIPIDDVSDKKMYRDMPAMIKIKSNLSVKRAKQLIDDLMKQKDLQQKAVGTIQWSLQFKQI